MIAARMFRRVIVIICVALCAAAPLLGDLTKSADTCRLFIDRSFTRVSGAKATLTIDPLVRNGESFQGDYQMKVTPFFFKSETGKLEIFVSNESLAKATNGIPVEITGTALTDGEDVKRKVNARATPRDKDRGELRVWFKVDERELVFQTTYRLHQ
jgi:hypothetical protein